MTGTITSPSLTEPPFWKSFALPFATGDRVTWTLQYDRSGPGGSGYSPMVPLITNIVDQTTGYSFFSDYYPPWSQSGLSLSRSASGTSLHAEFSSHGVDTGDSAALNLTFHGSFSPAQLASAPLNSTARL